MRRGGDRTGRYEGIGLSPVDKQPLLQNTSMSLDAMTTGSIPLAFRVVSAISLRAAQKNITSHPQIEVTIVLNTGNGQNTIKNGSNGNTVQCAFGQTFRSEIVKSSLNPIWNLDVNYGEVDPSKVRGVLFTVRHIGSFNRKKDLGQLMLSMSTIAELISQGAPEQNLLLSPTQDMIANDGYNNTSIKFGELRIQFAHSYGLTKSYTALSAPEIRAKDRYVSPRLTDPSRLDSTSANYIDHNASNPPFLQHEDTMGSSMRNLNQMQKHDVVAEVKELQSYHQTKPLAGETWYAIDAEWISNWLLFATKYKGDLKHSPGEIQHVGKLVEEEYLEGIPQIRKGITIKKDFRMINKASWNFYKTKYGGGPAVEVMIPMDCDNPKFFIANVELHVVGRVNAYG